MYESVMPPARTYMFSGDSESLTSLSKYILECLHKYEKKVNHEEREEYAVLAEEPGYIKACIENCNVEMKYDCYGVYLTYAKIKGCDGYQVMNANKFIRQFTKTISRTAEKYQFVLVNNCTRNVPTSCVFVKDYSSTVTFSTDS